MNSETSILKTLNREALIQRATFVADGLECHFVGDPVQTNGVTILRVYFPNQGNTWAARIPFDQEWSFYEMSIQPLEYIARHHPNIPAPRVHDYVDGGTVGENAVGVAYMLIDWLDGSHLKPWSLTEPPTAARHRVLDQVVDMMLEMLLKNPVDGDILFYGVPHDNPASTSVSTKVWMTESIDRPIRRNLRQRKTSMVIDNLIQRSMIDRYVVSEWIDWDAMFAQPLQKWAVFPKLIEHVPGYAPPDLPPEYTYLNFAEDKAYFVAILKQKELKLTGKTCIAKLVEGSTERSFFEMSHNAPAVHKEFASRFCKRTRGNLDAAARELECFLSQNSGFSRSDEGVANVEKELTDLAEQVQ